MQLTPKHSSHILHAFLIIAIIFLTFATATVMAQNTTNTTTNQTSVTSNTSLNRTSTTFTAPRPAVNQTLRPLDFMLIPSASTGTTLSWIATPLKFTWESIVNNAGFCRQDSQCLITNSGDESLDGQVQHYFTSTADTGKPKCINSGQYVLDHYCAGGQWSSRTRDLFLTLTTLAEQANANDYSVTCSTPRDVFNDIQYITSSGVRVSQIIGEQCNPFNSQTAHPCINNACVARYQNGIAFGTSLNEPINSQKSFLTTLNLSTTFCDNVQGSGYQECSPGQLPEHIYYNPDTQTLIFIQNDQLPPVDTAQAYDQYIRPRHDSLVSYANNNINDPGLDKNTFARASEFNHISLTRANGKEIFGYKSTRKTQFRYDYTGIRYQNIDLGQNACSGFIKLYDDRAYCEQQPTPGTIYVVGQSIPGNQTLSTAWIDMTAKVRP